MHRHDAGVFELREHMRFFVEVFRERAIRTGGVQNFNRHATAKHAILGEIDGSHAATAQESDDAVASGEQHPREESAIAGG